MTYAEREEMFSKEALDQADLMKLFNISRTKASELCGMIRYNVGDRLHIQGKVHILDFFKYFGIDPRRDPRYSKKIEEIAEEGV